MRRLLLSSLLVWTALGAACSKGEDPPPAPPAPAVTEGDLGFERLLAGVGAAVTFTDDTVLLIVGETGYRYRPSDWTVLSMVTLPVAPDASLRWDAEHALLFSGDRIVRVALETGAVVEETTLAELDLPDGWTAIDAAAALDGDGWMLFRGDEALVYDQDSGLVSGPFGLETFGPREAWPATGITAAFGTFDGRVVALGGDRMVELDLEAERFDTLPVGTRALLPDLSALKAPLGDGLTAATSLPNGGFLMTRDKTATLYSPWAGGGGEPFDLGFAPDAAVRWSDGAILLFTGRSALLYDVEAGEVRGSTTLSALGLPEAWPKVDAAALADAGGRRWIVFRGDSYGVLTLVDGDEPSFAGPTKLTALGLPVDEAWVDAATELLDGGVLITRGPAYRIIDLAAGTLSERYAFNGDGGPPAAPSTPSSPLAP